jgi:hypothetical protein
VVAKIVGSVSIRKLNHDGFREFSVWCLGGYLHDNCHLEYSQVKRKRKSKEGSETISLIPFLLIGIIRKGEITCPTAFLETACVSETEQTNPLNVKVASRHGALILSRKPDTKPTRKQ